MSFITDTTDTVDTTEAYFVQGASTTDDTGTVWTGYTATEHTVSPWGPGFQHGAPPSALVTHAMESIAPDGGRLVRVTTELFGAVPVARLQATARIVRPGRRICHLEAVVRDDSGREVVRGTAWWVRTHDTTELENPDVASASGMVPLEESTEPDADTPFLTAWPGPYTASLELRPVPGAGNQLWVRSRMAVVAGVDATPWSRLMSVADVANGTDRVLDPREWQFMNTDLTVSLHRLPVSGWIGVQAEANFGPDGAGLTIGRLSDERGPVGSTNQSLLLQRNR